MFYDDLPIWGFIGKVEKILHPGDRTEFKYYLFTHIHFEILYNGNRIIEVGPASLSSSDWGKTARSVPGLQSRHEHPV